MLRIERTNQLHVEADQLHNRIVRFKKKATKDEHRIYRGMIVEGSIASYVEDTLNDADAWTGKDKDALKYEKLDWKRRASRSVGRYYYKPSDNDGDNGLYTMGLDIQFNRTDRIYTVEVRHLKDNETLTNNGDIKTVKAKENTGDDTKDAEKPNTAEMVKNLEKEKEGLTTSLNAHADTIAERDATIVERDATIVELEAKIERLKKDKEVLVHAIKNTPRVPKVLKAMVI